MSNTDHPSLSYVLTTRNKLPYLRCVVKDILDHRQPDEELVVTDGASTDGSAEYLEEIRAREPLVTVISEPDICQADGMNKALLMARGDIIKIATDDDALSFPVIHHIKAWMLQHREVDYVVGTMAESLLTEPEKVTIPQYVLDGWDAWLRGDAPFAGFGDTIVMYRRTALPIVGLYHTGVACIDYEQAYRLTSQRQLQIAFFSGVMACRLLNPESVTYRPTFAGQVNRDLNRLDAFYALQSCLKRRRGLVRAAIKAFKQARCEKTNSPGKRRGPVRAAIKAFKRTLRGPRKPRDTNYFPDRPVCPVEEAFAAINDWMTMYNSDLERFEFILGPPPQR